MRRWVSVWHLASGTYLIRKPCRLSLKEVCFCRQNSIFAGIVGKNKKTFNPFHPVGPGVCLISRGNIRENSIGPFKNADFILKHLRGEIFRGSTSILLKQGIFLLNFDCVLNSLEQASHFHAEEAVFVLSRQVPYVLFPESNHQEEG